MVYTLQSAVHIKIKVPITIFLQLNKFIRLVCGFLKKEPPIKIKSILIGVVDFTIFQ